MKIKTLIAVAVVFGAFTLTSCKKERTCKCTTTINGTETTSSTTMSKAKEADQKAACEALNISGTSTTCTLED